MHNPAAPQCHAFNIREFGAVGDGRTKDTAAIQGAIDACAESGGGVVYCSPGTYLTGTIFLKSEIDLHLETGATILGSPDIADYDTSRSIEREFRWDQRTVVLAHLIYAVNADHISISGRGTIDGNGRTFFDAFRRGEKNAKRPWNMLAFVDCRDVSVSDVNLVDSPGFTVWPHACQRVKVHGVSIRNNGPNTDGINPDCCDGVVISDCYISTGDDCIAIKSHAALLGKTRPCQNVTVTNCTLTTHKCGVRLGYEGDAPIRNCTFSNLVMVNTRTGINMLVPRNPDYGIEHGPTIENISFDNIVMDTRLAVFLNIADDARCPGAIRNISISNVEATTERGCYIGGSHDIPIEGVRISNMNLKVRGPMDDVFAEQVPYPYAVFGRFDVKGIPHALFCRDVRDVRLHNIRVDWTGAQGSWCSALRCEDAEDVDVDGLVVGQGPDGKSPVVSLKNVRSASVRACRAAEPTRTFLQLLGDRTANITAVANDLARNVNAFESADEVPKDALHQIANALP